MNINLAIVCGRLTADPELRSLPSGQTVTNFSLATNRTWTQDGQKKEQVEFHRVVVFGKQGDACATFLRKGAAALVEGRLQTQSWETDGIRHYRTEIVAENVQFGPRNSDGSTPAERPVAKAKEKEKEDQTPEYPYPDEEINPEDIPF